jgi:hypothetical protein
MRHNQRWTKVIGLLLVTIAAVSAEVMDKEPGLNEIWGSALLAACLAWALGRVHPLLGGLALFPSLPVIAAVSECHDQFVGPAILREAGSGYIAQAHAALGFIVLSYAAGAARWRGRQTRNTPVDKRPVAEIDHSLALSPGNRL